MRLPSPTAAEPRRTHRSRKPTTPRSCSARLPPSGVSMMLYAAAGIAGVPWFAGGQAGFEGPTFGYVLGSVPEGALVRVLARSGAGRTFVRTIVPMTASKVLATAEVLRATRHLTGNGPDACSLPGRTAGHAGRTAARRAQAPADDNGGPRRAQDCRPVLAAADRPGRGPGASSPPSPSSTSPRTDWSCASSPRRHRGRGPRANRPQTDPPEGLVEMPSPREGLRHGLRDL